MHRARVFIDGEAGTTGLHIRERLGVRDDIDLIHINEAQRKDPKARRAAYEVADIALLCLPDQAAVEAVALCADLPVRLIDSSTSYRVSADWVFGFPELNSIQREQIHTAKYVSNPGCWSTGAIGLLAPLIGAGALSAEIKLTINGVSGYSGGGKSLIAEFESGRAGRQFVYGLEHNHKHFPEIMYYAGLAHRPIFIPSVGAYAQGMAVQIPLHLDNGQSATELHNILSDHYKDSHFVHVVPASRHCPRVNPECLNGSNVMEIAVYPSESGERCLLLAILDNLGKGASGAAVQNLNIMLGLDETLGL